MPPASGTRGPLKARNALRPLVEALETGRHAQEAAVEEVLRAVDAALEAERRRRQAAEEELGRHRREAEQARRELEAARSGARPPESPSAPAEGEADGARRSLKALLGARNLIEALDGIEDADEVLERLWTEARRGGLRLLLLADRGRRLFAERALGFEKLEGEGDRALRRLTLPYEEGGLFGACAREKAVYAGPRPPRGLPVELILALGRQAPAWCVIVPLLHRGRWGRFLYLEAETGSMETALRLELAGRWAVRRQRAAQLGRLEVPEEVGRYRRLALEARRRAAAPPPPAPAESPRPLPEPVPLPDSWRPPAELFDEEGELLQPLDPEAILSRVGELPPVPRVAGRVLSMLQDPETTVQQLQEVILTDPALAGRLLQIANSSWYGSMRDCDTVSEAVVRLGFSNIRSWLLATVTRTVFVEDASTEAVSRLWRLSLLGGMGAELLAGATAAMGSELAFLGGLLQNIGILLLARRHPAVFAEVVKRVRREGEAWHRAERGLLGFDHADLGALLLDRWGLGEGLVQAVAHHHRLETAGAHRPFAALIALSEAMAALPEDAQPEEAAQGLALRREAQELGLGADELEDLVDRLQRLGQDRWLMV